jgi:4-amino-4-deoxychorismate lyase
MPPESTLRDRNTAGFELIETLRWEPEAGFVRLDCHLARLAASASALGFAFSQADIMAALSAKAEADAPLRMRVALAEDGSIEVSAQPFSPLPADTVWRLAFAATRLDSRDPFLRLKTSCRTTYDAARAECSRDVADEVILLNENGNVCEGTITNVFIEDGDGKMLTPHVACGLLPGVLRGELLESGRAVEAELTTEDMRQAQCLYVGNSLRGLIRAVIAA